MLYHRMLPACGLLIIVTSAALADRVVTYAFDQSLDTLLRIEDKNGDGDTLDPGEVINYIDDTIAPAFGIENSQGLLAVGLDDVYATDNFAPDNVVRLRDLNGDGDAFDAGERSIFHSGALPGGFSLSNPVTFSRGPDDAFYVINNNTLDETNPESIYKYKDLNADGDVDDPNEVTEFFQMGPAGACCVATTFDVEFDNSGNAYVMNITDPNQIESIDIIDSAGTTFTEWVTSSQLLTLNGSVITTLSYSLTHDPATDEVIVATSTLGGATRILALKDNNGSGMVDSTGEVRTLWESGVNDDGVVAGTARDIYMANDGSIVFVEATQNEDQVFRLVDTNQDGDFFDANESFVLYDGLTADAAGQLSASNLLSITAIVVPEAANGDFDGNGSYECADVDSLVAEIAAGTNDIAFDLTGDGIVDTADLDQWLVEAGAAELASGNPFLPGDANLDGFVDNSDFNVWNNNKFTQTAAWCAGDFDADGSVDGSDFNIWNNNKFTSSGDLAAVPEPTLAGWLLWSGFMVLRRRAPDQRANR